MENMDHAQVVLRGIKLGSSPADNIFLIVMNIIVSLPQL
jgi:hypothetical protein